MPLTIVEQPPTFSSAYKPLTIGITSTKHPNNTTPGESGIAILTIKVADAADVATYGSPLDVGDVFIGHSTVALGILPVGQTLKVTGSNIPAYDGVWRVLKEVSDKVKVINADDFGVAGIGTMEKYYEGYTLIGKLGVQAVGGTTLYDVSPDLSSGVFYLDPSDRIRATFKDVFGIADSDLPTQLIDAEKYITQKYGVLFEEAYNIPGADGVSVYTKLEKTGATTIVRDKIAVNSVQPYHHVAEVTGSTDLLWEDDLDAYTVDSTGEYRFLTYRNGGSTYSERTAQRCAHSDAVWLAFLFKGTDDTYRIRRKTYQASGAATTTFEDVTLEKDSYLINVGPEASSFGTDVVRYSVSLYFGSTELIPEIWFTIDATCYAGTRFYALNRFGAIDSYTVDGGKASRSVEVKRSVLSKPMMGRRLTVAGDYNRRTYASDPVATYEQTTRKEGIEAARWILDELLSSPDVRIQIYNRDYAVYTPVIFDTDKANAGVRASAFNLSWSLGVDNIRQTR